MKFRIQKGSKPTDISAEKWKVGFYGIDLDDRGKDSIAFLSDKCDLVVKVEYFPTDFLVSFDGVRLEVDYLFESLKQYAGEVILDATTLGFVEILLLSKNLNSRKISFLYIEPGDYFKPQAKSLLHKRDFELSGEIAGFKAIPGHSAILTDDHVHRVIFILGFEASRVEKAFEDHQMIDKKSCDLIFGFPAFKPGWEMDSFANHVKLISEYNLRGEIKFAAATDPLATYSIIKKIQSSTADDTQLFLAPLGTKPMAIGCAIFLAENPEAAVLYDHPVKRTGRSSSSSVWHLYDVNLETSL